MIAITQFKESKVCFLTIYIVRYTFQTTEEECLAHNIEVAWQRIHEMHQMFWCIGFQILIIGFTSERVVEDFMETFTDQLLTNEIL